MSTTTPVIRAIDIGYGACKFTRGYQHSGEYLTDCFPSLVKQLNEHSAATARNTCQITLNNVDYEAGKDMDAVFDGGDSRTLHDNFTQTDEYSVLLKTTLYYIDEPRIDLLVVGLPASYLSVKSDRIRKLIIGTHEVQGKKIVIHDVLVVSQPVGGFMSIVQKNKLSPVVVKNQRNLLIDMGFYTVDFIAAKGLNPMGDVFGSSPYGMHQMLTCICEMISKDFKINYDNISRIDEGLRTGHFTLFSKKVGLDKYVKKSIGVFKPAIKEISNKIGDGRDLEQLVLVGGGAKYIEPLLKKAFPQHPIITSDSPQLSNVIGFQFMGELKLGVANKGKKHVA